MAQTSPKPQTVKVGTRVDLELLDQHGNSERLSVEIVEDRAADFEAGFLGVSTPLAKTILGQPAGRKLPYRAGDLAFVRILAITAGDAHPDSSKADQRDAVIRKAVSDSDRTNALLFASSFSGKWGDYDPSGVEAWDTANADDHDEPAKE